MKKISIIGANGRISREVIKNIYEGINSEDEFVFNLLTSEKESTINQMQAFLLDFENSLFLANSKAKKLNFNVTQDYHTLENSDIIIIAASKIPTPEEKLEFKKIDNTGRLANCKVNLDLVLNAGEQIKKFAPHSVVIMVTNQVDIMCKIMRGILGREQVVLGIGNSIDSARFRFCLFRQLRNKFNINQDSIMAHIIGYHNNGMFLLRESLRTNIAEVDRFLKQDDGEELIEACLQETKEMGSYISKLGRVDPQFPPQISGAFITPAKAISEVVLTYTGEGKKLESVLNIIINDSRVAEFYGLDLYSEIAVPVLIKENHIETLINYRLSTNEQAKLKSMQQELDENIIQLKKF